MSVSGELRPVGSTGSRERRPLTVLFADLAGSTSIAERMDPEDWTNVVGEAFTRLNHTVEHYGGTVARLMGDGVLAFFGAPEAHEDDPERAVRCGLEMTAAIDDLAADQKAIGAAGLRVRVGVNTGPVVVGLIGTDKANEYTAMGDTVNVAARMQAAARPGTVLVTAATHRFVTALVEATDVGLLELKGKSEMVHAYEITGLKTGAVRRRGLVGMRPPMVGRDAQLARLQQLLQVVRAGQRRVACVIGEPGIGKSRLLAELRSGAEDGAGSARWIEGQCLSYGESMPYHLVIDLLRSAIGVTPTTDETQIAQALENAVRVAAPDDWSETYAYLGHLLSLHLSPEMRARISLLQMETLKRYVSSIVLLLRGVSNGAPIVVVCDDVHWADTASVEVLLQVVTSAALPVLFVLSSRAERSAAGWRLIAGVRDFFGDALTEIKLDPLSVEDSRALVSSLLHIESLPVAIRELILAKAEGNPFFVEEVTRMLIDRGAVVREGDRWVATELVSDIEIPDTLHGLLLARIDRLPQESKRTLRVASVIGRQFGVTLLERLLEDSPG